MKNNYLCLLAAIWMMAGADCFAVAPKLPAQPKMPVGEKVNVRDFGAVGDGKTDDTEDCSLSLAAPDACDLIIRDDVN